METDVLIIGAVELSNWAAPPELTLGGKHMVAVHKLIGGSRVVDTLGSDDADIAFSGQLFGDDALGIALALDQMRIGGQPQAFFAMGQAFTVVVSDFQYKAIRFPQYFTYSISLTVAQNNAAGSLLSTAVSVGALVANDLSAAVSLFGG